MASFGHFNSGPVSLETLARHLGLSKSTVSRALRNLACIAPATRHRVQEAARQLGYRANPYISALMLHLQSGRRLSHQGTLALLDTLPDPQRWRSIGVHRHFHEGAEARAAELGFTLERHWCGRIDRSTPSRLTRILQARGIHGVLIPPLFDQADSNGHLPIDGECFSCVTLGHRMSQPSFCFALNDQFATAQTAHVRLRRLGYDRVGLAIPAHTNAITNNLFQQGFAVALDEAGRSSVKRAIFIYEESSSQSQAAFTAWLRSYRPNALLVFNPNLLGWIKAAGKRVPDDLAVGFLDLDWDLEGLGGMDQNSRLVGAFATELLVQMVYRNQTGPAEHPHGMLVEGFWKDGWTAPARKRV
ncbi:MAG: LacI family DNA-binding transcriptional regulator [Candidatus Methylacidiphilales bacterium]